MSDRGAEGAINLAACARTFLDEALPLLADGFVIPTPKWHPFVSVGVDYFGPDVMALPAFDAFASAIEQVAPKRFAPLGPAREFPSNYVFRFLEAVVARAGREHDYASDGEAASRSVDELVGVLSAEQQEVYCCRTLCHFTTVDGSAVTVGEVTVFPEGPNGARSFEGMIEKWVPGAAATFRRDPPMAYGPPHSVVVAQGAVRVAGNPYEVVHELAQRIDRFLLSAYLFGGWTITSGYEVQGAGSFISHMRPDLRVFAEMAMGRFAHRTGTLTPDSAVSIAAIQQLVADADVKRSGMATTSIDTALWNLHRSYTTDRAFTAIIDLATALEAALVSGDAGTDGVTAKLRSRAAALLATDGDSGRAIHDDINKLYGIRSKLVHGGQVSRRDLEKLVSALSTAPPGAATALGIGLEHAVDRMRDLARRAILARLCLASGDQPRWPLSGASVGVDAELADDDTRAAWRAQWHNRLDEIGAASAGQPAEPLRDLLSSS